MGEGGGEEGALMAVCGPVASLRGFEAESYVRGWGTEPVCTLTAVKGHCSLQNNWVGALVLHIC